MARKILLADDSVTAQNMGRKILADAGYDVITVNNGSAALKRITEVKPDLIVLDVYMPGYSGLEVCQRIKDADETEHIPVLLTVGKLEPFKPEEARRVRADGHIVKPFEASELLTAITRLEDRMVPQADGSRFSTSVSGVERFGSGDGRRAENSGDPDTGWKSRLRFPSKKKKEEVEPEPEEAAGAAPFREFRKGKGKSAASAPFAVKAPAPPGQEPGLVPDIPRDITPDELDALSALAAKLDGPIPAAENIVPLAEAAATPAAQEKTKPSVGAAEAQKEKEAEAERESAEKESKTDAAIPVAAAEATAPTVDAPPAAAIAAKGEGEIPAKPVEVAAGTAVAAAEVAAVDTRQHETTAAATPAEIQSSETRNSEAAAASVTVNTAQLAQEAAPVDRNVGRNVGRNDDRNVDRNDDQHVNQNVNRNDEPMFTSAASAVDEKAVASDKVEEKVEAKAFEVVQSSTASAADVTVIAKSEERATEASKGQELKTEPSAQVTANSKELPVREQTKSVGEELPGKAAEAAPVAAASAASGQAAADTEELTPSEAELAQALRLLTPAGGSADAGTIPSHGTLVAAGQLLAEEALRNAASGPRWIAQPVALSAEEAAISLEAEMFRAFMTIPTAGLVSLDPSRMTGVSAIEAAVENRLAAAELAASGNDSSKPTPAQSSSAPLPETIAAEAPAEAKAISAEGDARAEVSGAAKIDLGPTKAEAIDAARVETEKAEKEARDSRAEVAELLSAPASASAALSASAVSSSVAADATSQPKVEAAAEPGERQPVSEAPAAAAIVEEDQESSSDVGGEESMAKDNKKSGKSNWHQIRTATAGAGGDVVEAAKQAAESGSEEFPKAMAAAAAEGAPAPDASTIASIVDSVMADLRPKIVEEIAKKLAGK